MKEAKIGTAAAYAAELEEMDKLLMKAGVTHFTARECFGLTSVKQRPGPCTAPQPARAA